MPEHIHERVCVHASLMVVCLFLCNNVAYIQIICLYPKNALRNGLSNYNSVQLYGRCALCGSVLESVFFSFIISFCMWVEYYSTFCLLFFFGCSVFPSDSVYFSLSLCVSQLARLLKHSFSGTQMCQLIKNYAHLFEQPCSAVDEQLRNMHFNSGQMLLHCPIIRPCSNFIDLFTIFSLAIAQTGFCWEKNETIVNFTTF